MRRSSCVLLAVAALAAPGPAVAGPILDAAESELLSDPLYVAPGSQGILTGAQAKRLRTMIQESDTAPIYVALLPAAAGSEADGSAAGVVRELRRRLPGVETVAVMVGSGFRAGSDALPPGQGAQLADQAFRRFHERGIPATLLGYVRLVNEAAAAPDADGEVVVIGPDDSFGFVEGDPGTGIDSVFKILFPLALIGAILFFVLRLVAGGALVAMLFRRFGPGGGTRVRPRDVAEVKAAAQEDLDALVEDIRALDDDVERPDAPQKAKEAYLVALDRYEYGGRAFDSARSADELERVSSSLEEGRYRMEVAKALLAGREPPERRPPCFFDPRHGPSTRDVEWSPPWGEPRPVPVCEADAVRLEAGEQPDPRYVTVDGRRTAWWNASGGYGPWMAGYFGGGLLPGLLIGSVLGSSWGASDASASSFSLWDADDAEDSDAGSDFGGGDFGGGGDGGGGDVGGGDFGGGGDVGGGDF